MTEIKKELRPMPYLYKRLFSLIPRGNERLVSVSDLANALDTDVRHIQGMIYNLVVKFGIPVCSYRGEYQSGVFIPVNESQRIDGLVTIKEQVRSTSVRISAVEEANLDTVREYEALYPELSDDAFQVPHTQMKLTFDLSDIS